MEVISTSKILSSETENIITAYNLETMAMNYFVMHMIWWDAKYKAMHVCKYEVIHSFMMEEMRKSALIGGSFDTMAHRHKIFKANKILWH